MTKKERKEILESLNDLSVKPYLTRSSTGNVRMFLIDFSTSNITNNEKAINKNLIYKKALGGKIIFDKFDADLTSAIPEVKENALRTILRAIDADNSTSVWRYSNKDFENILDYCVDSNNKFIERVIAGDKTLPDDIANYNCSHGGKRRDSFASKICKYMRIWLRKKEDDDDYFIYDSYVRFFAPVYLKEYGLRSNDDELKIDGKAHNYNWYYNELKKLYEHVKYTKKLVPTITITEFDHLLWNGYNITNEEIKHSQLKENYKEKIKKFKKDNYLTNKQLAQKLGVNPVTLHRWLNDSNFDISAKNRALIDQVIKKQELENSSKNHNQTSQTPKTGTLQFVYHSKELTIEDYKEHAFDNYINVIIENEFKHHKYEIKEGEKFDKRDEFIDFVNTVGKKYGPMCFHKAIEYINDHFYLDSPLTEKETYYSTSTKLHVLLDKNTLAIARYEMMPMINSEASIKIGDKSNSNADLVDTFIIYNKENNIILDGAFENNLYLRKLIIILNCDLLHYEQFLFSIGKNAFKNCINLEEIDIYVTISDDCLDYNSYLPVLDPDKIKNSIIMQEGAFSGCYNLNKIVVNDIDSIGFMKCEPSNENLFQYGARLYEKKDPNDTQIKEIDTVECCAVYIEPMKYFTNFIGCKSIKNMKSINSKKFVEIQF